MATLWVLDVTGIRAGSPNPGVHLWRGTGSHLWDFQAYQTNLTGWAALNGGGTPGTILELVANGSTGVAPIDGANATHTFQFDLEPVNTDFGSMDTLSIFYSTAFPHAADQTYVDDTGVLYCRILASDGTTVYAESGTSGRQLLLDYYNGSNWSSTSYGTIASNGSGTIRNFEKTRPFTLTAAGQSATKADWDSAFIEITWVDTRNMGSDASGLILVDFHLTGTYTTTTAVPATITDLSANPDNQQVALSWTAPNNNGFTITNYEYRLNGGAAISMAKSTPGFTVTGLTNGVSYNFEVRAINTNGAALWSNLVSSTPLAAAEHLFLGDTLVTAIKLGDVNISAAYLGDTQIFPASS